MSVPDNSSSFLSYPLMQMDELMGHSGLRDAGVDADAAVEGAAAGLSMSLHYCGYLASMISDAVTAGVGSGHVHWLPHNNAWSVFCDSWHASSLARLSDADLANAWRLA